MALKVGIDLLLLLCYNGDIGTDTGTGRVAGNSPDLIITTPAQHDKRISSTPLHQIYLADHFQTEAERL